MTTGPRLTVIRVGRPDGVGHDPRLGDLLGRLRKLGRHVDTVVAVPDDTTIVARAVRRARQDRAELIVVLADGEPGERTVGGTALAVDVLGDGGRPARPVGARPVGPNGRSFRLDPDPGLRLLTLGDPADLDEGLADP